MTVVATHDFETVFRAVFPHLRLQAPPESSYSPRIDWNDNGRLSQPQPLDERMEFRLMVKRRSDANALSVFSPSSVSLKRA